MERFRWTRRLRRGSTWDGSITSSDFAVRTRKPCGPGRSERLAGQFRGPLDARVEFEFREWGKLQMALAGGSEHMNVLATGIRAQRPQPSGGDAIGGGGGAGGIDGNSQIVVGAGAVDTFAIGDMVAVDADYAHRRDTWGRGLRRRM